MLRLFHIRKGLIPIKSNHSKSRSRPIIVLQEQKDKIIGEELIFSGAPRQYHDFVPLIAGEELIYLIWFYLYSLCSDKNKLNFYLGLSESNQN